MNSALPLAYATRHIHSYGNPDRPDDDAPGREPPAPPPPTRACCGAAPRSPAPLSTRPAPGH